MENSLIKKQVFFQVPRWGGIKIKVTCDLFCVQAGWKRLLGTDLEVVAGPVRCLQLGHLFWPSGLTILPDLAVKRASMRPGSLSRG